MASYCFKFVVLATTTLLLLVVVPVADSLSSPSPVMMGMTLNNGNNNGMTKIEGAAVKRFTQYNKLCKTCPTLLQPKIATLEELIMGLSTTDRQELLNNVAERMEITEQQQQDPQQTDTKMLACSSPENLFKFQTGTDAIITASANTKSKKPSVSNSNKKGEEKMTSASNSNSNSKNQIKIKTPPSRTIVNNKIEKVRLKFESNKHKLTQVTYLVNVTTLLLSSRGRKSGNDDGDNDEDIDDDDGINNTITTTISDPTVYHAIDELQIMTRSELKMARLKYMACCSKYQQKIAKSRLKMYKLVLEQEEQEPYNNKGEEEQQQQHQLIGQSFVLL